MPNPGRKKREFRKEQLPDHVVTADSREPSQLAMYPDVLKSHEKRRGTDIEVPATVKMMGLHKFSVKEIENFKVDTRYQRDEVTQEVNNLITIIKHGGIIPDPISLARRKYENNALYIVDGQQRWWAHVDTSTPMHGIVYDVTSYDDEVKLFHVLNKSRRLTAETRLRSLPGALGDALRFLNEDDRSALRGLINMNPASGTTKYSGMIVARGLTALITNTNAAGGLDTAAATFGTHYKNHKRMAEGFMLGYAQLMASIFVDQRLSHTVAIGFGRVCYAAWTKSGEVSMPTERQLEKFRKVNWAHLTPTHAIKWLPVVLEEITEIWPVDLVKEKK